MGWNSDDWKDVAKVIAKVAPALGTIIGVPVGGEDVYVVSNGGVDNHQSGLTSETSTGYSKIGFALNSNVISLYGLDISMFIP
jgi:hypothetical protein